MSRRFFTAAAAAVALCGSAAAQSPKASAPITRAPIVPLEESPPTPMPIVPKVVPKTPITEYSHSSVAPCAPECVPAAVVDGGFAKSDDGANWVGAEYLFSFVKNGRVPFALGSTGPVAGLGVLGSPGSRGIFGLTEADYGTFAGLRILGGHWFDDCHRLGIQGSAFLLEQRSVGERSGGQAVLARPFFDTNINAENSRILSAPGRFAGGLRYSTSNRVYGADLDGVYGLVDTGSFRVDALGGFKFFSLEETLDVNDFSQTLPGGVSAFQGVGRLAPATTAVSDHFSTQNRFYGAGLGLRMTWHSERWFATWGAKVSMGTVQQHINVDGTSTLSNAGAAPIATGGGLLALNSNSGHFTRNDFGVLPEVAGKLGYRVTSHLSLTAGYQFQYLTSVVRPGDQLVRTLNPTTIPTDINFGVPFGPAQPSMPFATTNFWMHGATVGLMFDF